MITRRSLVEGSLFATLLGSSVTGGHSHARLPAPAIPISNPTPTRMVIAQPGSAASSRFATLARQRGAEVVELGDDITPVFLRLRRQWATAHFAIAGLTSLPALIVMAQMGRDQGLRLAWHASHAPDGDGWARHDARGSRQALEMFADHLVGGANCGDCIGTLAFEAESVLSGEQETASIIRLHSPGILKTLHSWIITPHRTQSA